mmetsp:Transcript_15676/g.27796  ORF Transcript_15676/g.27796 Transcript_15676/m.27796 type:complete len:229 (-) Transcript_15676:929-1615(-)
MRDGRRAGDHHHHDRRSLLPAGDPRRVYQLLPGPRLFLGAAQSNGDAHNEEDRQSERRQLAATRFLIGLCGHFQSVSKPHPRSPRGAASGGQPTGAAVCFPNGHLPRYNGATGGWGELRAARASQPPQPVASVHHRLPPFGEEVPTQLGHAHHRHYLRHRCRGHHRRHPGDQLDAHPGGCQLYSVPPRPRRAGHHRHPARFWQDKGCALARGVLRLQRPLRLPRHGRL